MTFKDIYTALTVVGVFPWNRTAAVVTTGIASYIAQFPSTALANRLNASGGVLNSIAATYVAFTTVPDGTDIEQRRELLWS